MLFQRGLIFNSRWQTAKDTCSQQNAELALPTNEEDNKVFSDIIGYGYYDLWIGAEFIPEPGKFLLNFKVHSQGSHV